MFGMGMGKLGRVGGKTWNERTALWPLGTEPGLWIDPSYTSASYQDSAGTTPISAIGTLADSSNPVGLQLDRKYGATALADPGLHLSQATSAARPFASARVNLLTNTEDLTDAAWNRTNIVPTLSGDEFLITTTSTAYNNFNQIIAQTCPIITTHLLLRAGTYTSADVGIFDAGWGSSSSGEILSGPGTITQAVGGLFVVAGLSTSVKTHVKITRNDASANPVLQIYPGDSTSGTAGNTVYVSKPQINLGSTALPYQRVNTAADYANTGIIYDKFDAVDDALLSATVAAGVVGNSNMDCLIAVRRDSAANVIYIAGTLAGTSLIGCAESGSASLCFDNCGTPTTWVDGVQLAGGTSTTRATLHTTLTVGAWHILEFRGLNVSSWTTAIVGNAYAGYQIGGAIGGIMLFPAAAAADRDKARTRLAAKVGLVL